MDLLYVVNSGSQDVRWGGPLTGGLTSIIPLPFSGARIAAMPGQEHLYITGNKVIAGVQHAFLCVVETCTNTVVAEVDLGVGFAGQCAVPDAIGATRAFVAISQRVGDSDSGPDGGSNRIERLDVTNPAAPTTLSPAISPSGVNSAFGFLHLAWSFILNKVYASHRGDGTIYYFNEVGGQASLQSFSLAFGSQPVGLGISVDGMTLFISRRNTGDLLEYDLSANPPTLMGSPVVLPNAISGSNMFVAVASQNRVLVTSDRADGILYIYRHRRPQMAVPNINSLDLMASHLGQPAVNPDSTVAYVPRGSTNDIAQIDLSNMSNETLFPSFLASGISPTDIVTVRHEAALTLQAVPSSLSAACGTPTDIEIRVLNACGQEMPGVQVRAIPGVANVAVGPLGAQPTPATFRVTCSQGGAASVNFTTIAFPFVSLSVDVQCRCPQRFCVDFATFAGGPLPQQPGDLAGIHVETALQNSPNGPSVQGSVLRMFQGAVSFVAPPGFTIDDLTIRGRRFDPFLPQERVLVTHSGGATSVLGPGVAQQGVFDILCPFTGITQWIIFGGQETEIHEMCFSMS